SSNAPAPTDIYSLALHDALPISPLLARAPDPGAADASAHRAPARRRHQPRRPALPRARVRRGRADHRLVPAAVGLAGGAPAPVPDRKSTRLNSSHVKISYAGFCL